MSDTKHYRLSLVLNEDLWKRIDEIKQLSGKTRNAIIKELMLHSMTAAYEHYRELRILELKRLEKEKNTPYEEKD
jgi:hypothetical protein